jgi:hypothetical protein
MLAKTEEGKEGKGAQKANTRTKEWKNRVWTLVSAELWAAGSLVWCRHGQTAV